MRNDQILCQPQFRSKWKEDDYGVIGNWTGERKNHPWIQEQNQDINWKTEKFSWREPRK